MTVSVVIAGGGTGGHVFPGLALAEALRAAAPDVRVCFVGTERGIETRAVPAAGYTLETVDVLPWSRTLGARRLLAPVSAVRATFQARAILRRHAASVVVAMGGYASLPVALAARSRRIPVVVHEQNAIPGRANRISARLARSVAVTFAESAAAFPVPVRVVGNPVRAAIASMDRATLRGEAMRVFSLDPSRRTVLVTGGSRGARRLNDAASALARRWAVREDIQILLVAGSAGYAEPSPSPLLHVPLLHVPLLHVVEFVERIELAYAAADVSVARAGAGLAELACAGLPMILVPYPYARDDHQTANARAAERAGAAIVVRDAEAMAFSLGPVIESILDDEARAEAMRAAARGFARPRAADDLARIVLGAVGEGSA